MKYFDMYIILILLVKVAFILLSLYRLYVKTKHPENEKLLDTLDKLKERTEFIFITIMSILLIYLFDPRVNRLNMVDKETKLLLYLFGFVLLLTENWSDFIEESILFKKIQNVLA